MMTPSLSRVWGSSSATQPDSCFVWAAAVAGWAPPSACMRRVSRRTQRDTTERLRWGGWGRECARLLVCGRQLCINLSSLCRVCPLSDFASVGSCWCNVDCRWCWVRSLPLPWRSPTSTRGRGAAARTSSHEQHTRTSNRKPNQAFKPLHFLIRNFQTPLSEALVLIFMMWSQRCFLPAAPTHLALQRLFNQRHRWTMSKRIMNEQTHCWCVEVCFSLFWISTRHVCARPKSW